MFRKFLIPSLVLSLFFAFACAKGPGTANGNMGSVGLSFQLVPLEAGGAYQTGDGVQLTFTHFAVAFSQMSLINKFLTQALDAPFAADFPETPAIDVATLEDAAGVDYQGMTLTLDSPGNLDPNLLPPELAGRSVFLEAQAQNGGETCTLQVFLNAPGQVIDVDLEGAPFTVTRDEVAEALVRIDPNQIFSGFTLAPLCVGGATIPITEDSDLSDNSLTSHLLNAFSLSAPE